MRNAARIEKAVTGRSSWMTVCAEIGCTSEIQGEASSWRRNRVKACTSTVRPLIWSASGGGTESTAIESAAIRASGGRRRGTGGAEIDQPGVGRQGAGDLVHHVGPHIALAVHLLEDLDLGHERIADQLHLALLHHEIPEAGIFRTRLLQLRLEGAERGRGLDPGPAQPEDGEQDHARGNQRERIPHPFAESGQLRLQPGERRTAARTLLAWTKVDFNHEASVRVSGLTPRS